MAEALETIAITATNLNPTRIALGTWAIGGWMWGGSDEAESIRTIRSAVDRGINLIDMAPVYGFGHSEEIVGRALEEIGRHKVLIATKVGLDWRDGQPFRDGSEARIHKEIEESLRRLRTDVIDIYQVHWPDPNTPIEETAQAMAELHRAGKIRAVGVSNFSTEQMRAFRAVAPLHAAQPPYNLFEREAERDVLPYCRDNSIATLAYGSLCRGLLSGRMKADRAFSGDDLRRNDPKFQPPRLQQYLRAVEHLDAFARETYAASRPARRSDRYHGLEARCSGAGANRPHCHRLRPRSGRTRVHGTSGAACCLNLPYRIEVDAIRRTTCFVPR